MSIATLQAKFAKALSSTNKDGHSNVLAHQAGTKQIDAWQSGLAESAALRCPYLDQVVL